VLAARDVQLARDAGAVIGLLHSLNSLAIICVFEGDLEAAASLISEADAIREATGTTLKAYGVMYLAALRGRETEALAVIEAGIKDATVAGHGTVVRAAQSVTATLYNSLARYDKALPAAQAASAHPFDWGCDLQLHELIESAARTGEREIAVNAFDRLSEATSASGTDWALGVEARSRALLSEADVAESLYREALERLGRTGVRTELARAHLLYGEWLRRERRRLDARLQLRAAYDLFTAMGAEAFAERARIELNATGETARKRAVDTSADLTAQESQVCRLAADGATNAEIGTRLFISASTVDYHLRKAFRKLGVKSRIQLARRLPA
jgi:DNA-binding CsgD family transcriptional regulator